MKVLDVLNKLEEIAPSNTAESWDNVGLLIGNKNSKSTGILFALDATNAVVREAIDMGINVIITHHPVIFSGIKKINNQDNIINAIKNDIAIISMHTNLDKSLVNNVLAEKLGLIDICDIDDFMGKVGKLKKAMPLSEFAQIVKKELSCDSVSIAGKQMVEKVAVLGGSGGKYLYQIGNCDTFITGDISYHTFLDACDMQKNIIDAGHFETENITMYALKEKLKQELKIDNIYVSKVHKNIIKQV